MSRAVTLAGYALLFAGLVACQMAALLAGRIPTLGQAASKVARRPLGRWLLLAAWLWVGWHLFVRSHVAS
ncbi:MAG TPA: DUF6186 family protein [Acidimicrobiales bacterium]|nr:DUF6186 family protein [Acidimicrobiales bacterium]